jgi:hypothetical protein
MKLRLLTAVAVLVSGGVHLWLWYDVFRDENVVGPMFLLNVAASVVIAVLLLRWQHWLPAFLALGFGASTLGAFVIATTDNGLFGVHERWTGGWVFLAAAAELVAIIGGAAVLVREHAGSSASELEDGVAVRGSHLD